MESLQQILRARGWHDIADELLLAEAFPDVVGSNIPNGLAAEYPLQSTNNASVTFHTVDASDYRWISVHVIANPSSTVVVEQSNDNANWVPLYVSPASFTGGPPVSQILFVTGVYAGPVLCRYTRVRVVNGGGITTVSTEYWYSAPAAQTSAVAVGGLGPGTIDDFSGGVKIAGVVNQSTPTNRSSGQRNDLHMNAQGQPVVAVGSSAVVADGDADALTLQAWASNGIAQTGRPAIRPYVYNGATWDKKRVAVKVIDIPVTAITALTPVNIWTPAAGKKFRLMGWALSLTVAGGVILLDNAAGVFVPGGRTPLMAAGVGIVSPGNQGHGFLSAAANNILKADVTATGSIQGFVYGTEE